MGGGGWWPPPRARPTPPLFLSLRSRTRRPPWPPPASRSSGDCPCATCPGRAACPSEERDGGRGAGRGRRAGAVPGLRSFPAVFSVGREAAGRRRRATRARRRQQEGWCRSALPSSPLLLSPLLSPPSFCCAPKRVDRLTRGRGRCRGALACVASGRARAPGRAACAGAVGRPPSRCRAFVVLCRASLWPAGHSGSKLSEQTAATGLFIFRGRRPRARRRRPPPAPPGRSSPARTPAPFAGCTARARAR